MLIINASVTANVRLSMTQQTNWRIVDITVWISSTAKLLSESECLQNSKQFSPFFNCHLQYLLLNPLVTYAISMARQWAATQFSLNWSDIFGMVQQKVIGVQSAKQLLQRGTWTLGWGCIIFTCEGILDPAFHNDKSIILKQLDSTNLDSSQLFPRNSQRHYHALWW